MTDKNFRLSELSKISPLARQDHRHLLNKDGSHSLLGGLSRTERRILAAQGKKLAAEYNKVLKQLSISGVKFPANKIIREMAIEYTHRYASSGIHNQPISFNYFEPFLHIKLIKQSAPFAQIEPEINHLFHVEDFFDFITSNSIGEFKVSSLLQLPRDQIFHFSANGNIKDFSFLNGENREFVIAGFSMIRRGNSLHWYLIGGEELTEDEWDLRCSEQPAVDLELVNPQKRAFLAEMIADRGSSNLGKPCQLEGTNTHVRTIIAGEFDIPEAKHLSRCCLAEHENSFHVVCDDPEIFADTSLEGSTAVEMMMQRFDRLSVLWTLAEGFFQLPCYFNARLALNEAALPQVGGRIPKKKGGKGVDAVYVVIPSLEKNSKAPTSAITMVTLPQYEIETEGHWKRLADGEFGVDRHGNTIRNRTWIASSSKWKLTNSISETIFLKDTLATAKLKISDIIESTIHVADSDNFLEKSDSGELYIMRCSAMKERIFKVGYTNGNSNDRARQLSAATGVASSFIVVKKWAHADARRLEMDVHMMLSAYRLNDSREFFVADLSVIENIVNLVLDRINTQS